MTTANQFIDSISYPVLRYSSTGVPAGRDIALLVDGYGCPHYDLPFSVTGSPRAGDGQDIDAILSDLTGDVVDGRWQWTGGLEIYDRKQNTIAMIWIVDDRDEYERQEGDAFGLSEDADGAGHGPPFDAATATGMYDRGD